MATPWQPLTPEEEQKLHDEAIEETAARTRRVLGDPDYLPKNLKRLAEFKGKKPFMHRGEIVYAEDLDFPEVQLGALKELGIYTGDRVEKKQVNGALVIIHPGEVNKPEDAGE